MERTKRSHSSDGGTPDMKKKKKKVEDDDSSTEGEQPELAKPLDECLKLWKKVKMPRTYSGNELKGWKPTGLRLRMFAEDYSERNIVRLTLSFDEWKELKRPLRDRWRKATPDPTDRDAVYSAENLPTWKEVSKGLGSYTIFTNPPTMYKGPEAEDSDDDSVPWKATVSEGINARVCVWLGGVPNLAADAIVNAANTGCMGGGGVDGAVHRKAGKLLAVECATFKGCATGHTRITKGYGLPADFVLHTVGPIGEDPSKLRAAYESALALAGKHKLRTVGMCMISTGIFGYPLQRATHVALSTVRRWLEAHPRSLERVVFCCYTKAEYDCYMKLMPTYFPPKARKGVAVTTEDWKDPVSDGDSTLPEVSTDDLLAVYAKGDD